MITGPDRRYNFMKISRVEINCSEPGVQVAYRLSCVFQRQYTYTGLNFM